MGTRETWAEISLDSLKHNYQHLKKSSNKEIFPVLKANAYGHGDINVGLYLQSLNVEIFCVSSLDEAIHLEKNGISTDIMIFSYVSPSRIKETKSYNFIYTVANKQWIQEVEDLGLSLRMHLEVNVGMNRYGFKTLDEISRVSKNHNLEGIYMHFQRAEDTDTSRQQISKFKYIVDSLNTKPKWVHVGNASFELIKDLEWINGARLGLGLYGYRDDVQGLRPVMSIYSRITHLEHLLPGETVGYEYSYEVKEQAYYGTMPIGYADGFDMNNSKLPVIIGGKPFNIVGKICMDQTMLKLDESVKFYDVVELLGTHRTLEEISKVCQKSLYYLLTDIKERIDRIYV